jgi:hypothetical protein
MDENPVSLLNARTNDECAVAGRRSDEETGCVGERPTVGHGQQPLLLGTDVRREGALACAEDLGTY